MDSSIKVFLLQFLLIFHLPHANHIPLNDKINTREDVYGGNKSEQCNLNGILSGLQILRKIDSHPPHNCHRTRGGYKHHKSPHRISRLKLLTKEAQHYFCPKIDSPSLPFWLSSMLFFLKTTHEGEAYCFSHWIFCILGIKDITLIKYAPENQYQSQILVKKLNHSYYFGDKNKVFQTPHSINTLKSSVHSSVG